MSLSDIFNLLRLDMGEETSRMIQDAKNSQVVKEDFTELTAH